MLGVHSGLHHEVSSADVLALESGHFQPYWFAIAHTLPCSHIWQDDVHLQHAAVTNSGTHLWCWCT